MILRSIVFLTASMLALSACRATHGNGGVTYMLKNRIETEDLDVAGTGWKTRSSIAYSHARGDNTTDLRSDLEKNGFQLLGREQLIQSLQGNTLRVRYSYKNNNFAHPMWLYYSSMEEIEYYILASGRTSLWGPEYRGLEYQDGATCSVRTKPDATICIQVFERKVRGGKEHLCSIYGGMEPCNILVGRQLPVR